MDNFTLFYGRKIRVTRKPEWHTNELLGKTQVSHAERVPFCGCVSDTDSVRRLSNYTRLSTRQNNDSLTADCIIGLDKQSNHG